MNLDESEETILKFWNSSSLYKPDPIQTKPNTLWTKTRNELINEIQRKEKNLEKIELNNLKREESQKREKQRQLESLQARQREREEELFLAKKALQLQRLESKKSRLNAIPTLYFDGSF